MTTPRQLAQQAGYYVRRGSCRDTTDDREDRFYVGFRGTPFRPWSPGFHTARKAWEAAAELAGERVP